MNKKLSDLTSIYLRLPLYVAVMLTITQIIKFDFIDGEFNEDGYVESFQLVFLGLSIGLLFFSSYKFSIFKIYTSILGLFLATHFIRENDAFFDEYLMEHAWKIFAYSFVAIAVYVLIKNWNIFLNQVYQIKEHLSFGVFISGLTILHVFSRLYGKKDNWINLFEKIDAPAEQYRSIKDASEESIELLGYAIIFISIVELIIYAKKQQIKLKDA